MSGGGHRITLAKGLRMSSLRRAGVLRGEVAWIVSVQRLPPPDLPIAGTIFASTHVSLRLWFRAMYHLTQSKQGISSIELGRRLGVKQQMWGGVHVRAACGGCLPVRRLLPSLWPALGGSAA